jgi:hypothetical protein
MRIRIVLVLISLFLLGVTACPAQEFSCRASLGGVLPLKRSFASIELRNQIASRYAISIAGEFSVVESNVTPKLTMNVLPGLDIEAGFGWGHHWEKANCDDHNYHTYTLGLVWSKPISRKISFFVGPSMFWRSYQAHIGLHRGTLRLSTGLSFQL